VNKTILAFFLFCTSAFAITLDWPTVQELAQKHGAEPLRIRNDYRIGVISSTLDRRSYWPKLQANSDYPSQTQSLQEQLFYNPSDSSYLNKWVHNLDKRNSLGLTLSQELPFGVQFNANGSEWKHRYSVGGDPEVLEYGLSYQTDLRWQILSGNPTGITYKNAGLKLQETEQQRIVKEREFELSLLSDYVGFLNADGQNKLTQIDAALADSSRALAKRKFEAGLIPQTEYLTIEVSALQRIMGAASSIRGFEGTRDQFLSRLGLAPGTETTIPSDPQLPEIDTTTTFEIDPSKLPESKIARYAFEEATRSAKAERFPLPLQVEGRLFESWDGVGADRAAARDNISESKGGAIQITLDLLDRNEFFLRQERVKLNLREQEINYRDALRDADRAVRDAIRKLQDAKERLVSAEKLLQLSKLRETMTMSRFNSGTVSSRDLVEAQQDRLTSEQQWLTARGDWIVAALRMKRLQEQSR